MKNSTMFSTTVSGIPCRCLVLLHVPEVDLLPAPPPDVFEYRILDRKGYLAPWLERKLTDADSARLLTEYENHIRANRDSEL